MSTTVFIPDIHGDVDALKRSLDKSDIVDCLGDDVVSAKEDADIVILGDIWDRGDSNKKVIDLLMQLRTIFKITFIAGNHDAVMLDALIGSKDPRSICQWLLNGGYSVLAEMSETHNFPKLQKSNYDFPISLEHLEIDKQLSKTSLWVQRISDTHYDNIDFREALNRAPEILCSKANLEIFRRMQLVHRCCHGVLAVHSMITPECANNLDAYEKYTLGTAIDDRRISEVSDWDILSKRTGAGEDFITEATAKILLHASHPVVVHGHNIIQSGIPVVQDCHGVLEINLDVGISHYFHHGNFAYIKINKMGEITVGSKKGGIQKVGYIRNGSFHPAAA